MISRKNLLALLGISVSAFVLSTSGALAVDKHVRDLEKAATVSTTDSDTGANVAVERVRRLAAEKMVAQMQTENQGREAALADAQKQLAAATSGKNKSGVSSKELKAYQDQITDLNAKISQLSADRAQSDAKIQQLQAQLATAGSAQEMQQQADIERARREAAERAMAELQSASHDRDQQMGQLQQQLEAAKKAPPVPASDPQAAVEKARRQTTEAALQKAQNAASAADAENIRLSKANAVMQQQMAQLKATSTGDAKMAQVSDQLAQLEQRNNDLMAQLQAAKTQNETAAKAGVMTTSNDAATNQKIAELGKKSEADRAEFQALLEAETTRRQKLEAMLAQGGSATSSDKVDEMSKQVADLTQRNADLEKRLKDEQGTAPATGGAPANAAQIAELQKQISVMKSDNQMLASKLAAGASAAPAASSAAGPASGGDDQLAETKSSLASVKAERDEYRNLLQRERMEEQENKGKPGAGPAVSNAQIDKLEAERAELVKQLEFERSKNDSGIPGAATSSAPIDNSVVQGLQDKLANVQAEKDKLQKQLEVTQQDVIAARSKTSAAPAPAPAAVPSADVQALIEENKKLQAEITANASKPADADALQSEIASLRAQNTALSTQLNKGLAAAPDRAAMDNAAAQADFKVKQIQAASTSDVLKAQERFNQAEAENIRLSKALADARNKQQQAVAAAQMAAAAAPARVMMAAAPAPVAPAPMAAAPAAPAPMVAPMVASTTPGQISAPPRTTVAASQPVAQQPVASVSPVSYTPAPMAPMAPAMPVATGPNGSDIAGYLTRAGIPMVSGFEKVNKVSGPDFGAFRWDTGVVFGTAEQAIMRNDSGFEQAVNAYLSKTRDRCSGTFDQSFDAGQFAQHKNFAVADVACIMPDGTGAGAAMVFYYKDGTFNVVAHEGDITQFDQAMSTRDTFAKFMQGVL